MAIFICCKYRFYSDVALVIGERRRSRSRDRSDLDRPKDFSRDKDRRRDDHGILHCIRTRVGEQILWMFKHDK